MGHQLNFYLTPEDLALLEKRLGEQCSVLFLDARAQQPTPKQLSTLAVPDFGKTWLKVFLVPRDFLDSLVFEHVQQQAYWTVDLLRSPAMELRRCFYDGTTLRRGRLYYDRGYYDSTGNWVEKPTAFQQWAKKVFSVARRGLQKDAGEEAYIGKDAQAQRMQGRLRLVTD